MKKTTRDVNEKKPDPDDPFSSLNPEALWAQIGIDIPRQRAGRDEVRSKEPGPGTGIRNQKVGAQPQVPPAGNPVYGDSRQVEKTNRPLQAPPRLSPADRPGTRDETPREAPAAPPLTDRKSVV